MESTKLEQEKILFILQLSVEDLLHTRLMRYVSEQYLPSNKYLLQRRERDNK